MTKIDALCRCLSSFLFFTTRLKKICAVVKSDQQTAGIGKKKPKCLKLPPSCPCKPTTDHLRFCVPNESFFVPVTGSITSCQLTPLAMLMKRLNIQSAKEPWYGAEVKGLNKTQQSHEKKPPTFYYTGWLIGILIMVYYNALYNWEA